MLAFLLKLFLIGSVLYALIKGLHTRYISLPSRTQGEPLSKEEAQNILGIGADANISEVLDAHKRLMKKIHPDAGGNHYFASRLNQARDKMLEEMRAIEKDR